MEVDNALFAAVVVGEQKLGGATATIMCDLLAFEADRRAVNITINRRAFD